MNETVRTIMERRTVRRYRPDPIPEDILRQIIDCGLIAPSAQGKQGRHLLMLKSREDIDRLQAQLVRSSQMPGHDHYAKVVGQASYSVTKGAAPVFVVVSGDTALRCPAEDAALVLGNMQNAAWALGVGSCWINQLGPVGDEPAFRALLRELGVPDGYAVIGAACFGYPAAPPAAPAPRRAGSLTVRE